VCCSMSIVMRFVLLGPIEFRLPFGVVAVCCSMLRCVAACCGVLQCVAVRCSVYQRDAACCSVIECVTSQS